MADGDRLQGYKLHGAATGVSETVTVIEWTPTSFTGFFRVVGDLQVFDTTAGAKHFGAKFFCIGYCAAGVPFVADYASALECDLGTSGCSIAFDVSAGKVRLRVTIGSFDGCVDADAEMKICSDAFGGG